MVLKLEKVRVFTETFFQGSFGNGCGEYYIVLECTDRKGELHTGEKYARHMGKKKNEVELMSLIETLKSFNRKCQIELHMRKSFVSETIRAGRHLEWQRNNWKNKKGGDIKNSALWQQYIELSEGHCITVAAENETEYSGAMRLQMQVWLKSGR